MKLIVKTRKITSNYVFNQRILILDQQPTDMFMREAVEPITITLLKRKKNNNLTHFSFFLFLKSIDLWIAL